MRQEEATGEGQGEDGYGKAEEGRLNRETAAKQKTGWKGWWQQKTVRE